MQQISVDKTRPKAFILAPDGEVTAFKPENDQIWSLSLGTTDPGPFYLNTTYHLRARSMRVFPHLLIGRKKLTKSTDYSLPPTVTAYFPSAVEIEYSLNNQIFVHFCCFIPEPNLLVGTLFLKNTFNQPLFLIAGMGAILIPMGLGNPIHPEIIGHNHILSGRTETLYPILFMSSGPSGVNNPYPALQLPLTLTPGASEKIQWVLASKTSQTDSLETAQKWIAQDWQKALQKYKKNQEKKMVYIKTGQPNWDTAFYLTQVNAQSHLIIPNPAEPKTTHVRARLTDASSASPAIKKSQSGLSLLDVLHLTQVLLPAHTDRLTPLIEDFIARVDDQGFVRSNNLRKSANIDNNACPVLANLCLTVYEQKLDTGFLMWAFPYLRRFFDLGWLKNTKPEDKICPTWNTPEQLQLDTGLFNFDIWQEIGSGLDIRTALSPALITMLLREAAALKQIAHILGDRRAVKWYAQWTKKLQETIGAHWIDTCKPFGYLDYQTHQAPLREIYYSHRIHPRLKIDKHFSHPQRLQISLFIQGKHPKDPTLRLEGKNSDDETIIELVQPPGLRWVVDRAHVTTRQVFSSLETVYFQGFNPDDRFLIKTADYSQADISCLLPVWSGGIQTDHIKAIADNLIQGQSPACAFGIPETWLCSHPLPDSITTPINIQWNTLIIDGLVREGLNKAAMALFTNLMTPIMRGLMEFDGFYPHFDDKTALPIGAANAIAGLVPVGLFLRIAGIKLITPHQVVIWGENPFPWPVELSWQGLHLRKEGSQTDIIFPDGSQYHSQVTKPRRIKRGES